MTTLEWLMIVGAVSGLAALAVVLVARLVDETAEGSGGVTANRSAAEAAASQIEEQARTFVAPDDGGFATWNDWDRHFTARCTRLQVLYSSIGAELDAEFAPPFGKGDKEPTPGELAVAAPAAPTLADEPAQIRCQFDE